MAYNNKIIRRLHQDQFSSLEWLERMEHAQQSCCFTGDSPLSAELDATVTGLQQALERLNAGMRLERVLLFPLLRAAGENRTVSALAPHRLAIADLCVDLLHALRGLRGETSLIKRLGAPRSPGLPEPFEHWDAALHQVPALSRRLIRYLQLAETEYLPLADYLLGSGEWPRPETLLRPRSATLPAFYGYAASPH